MAASFHQYNKIKVLARTLLVPCIAPLKNCAASDMTARPRPAAVVGSMAF